MTATDTILHLGLGAFHRAHQAVVLQRLIDAGDATWRIVGANLRGDGTAIEAGLIAQGGAYTVETVTPGGVHAYQRITAIDRVIPHAADLAEVIATGADASTRIISFTVTEAGYYLDGEDRLDDSFADLAAGLEAARAGRVGGTLYPALAAILRARRRRGSGPVTLLCCDNLRHGGARSRSGLLQFLARTGDESMLEWVAANTTSPGAMVDRITPRAPPGVRERVRAATGVDDAVPVMAEDFLQWVIEDDFAAGRPRWEEAGAQLVESVAPYEEAKIRLLNASHSALAWGGALAGHTTIHDAVRDPHLRAIVADYARHDVFPCLRPSPVDLAAYLDRVLDRFGNAALGDTVARVAADGFAKLPGFIVPTIRERLAAGAAIDHVARLPALLLAFLQRWHAGALPFVHHDQAMDAAAAHAICAADDPVSAFCADAALFGDLAGDARLEWAVRLAFEHVAMEACP